MPAAKRKKTKGYELNASQKLDHVITEMGYIGVIQHLTGTMGWNSRHSPAAVQEEIAKAISHLTKACDVLERTKGEA